MVCRVNLVILDIKRVWTDGECVRVCMRASLPLLSVISQSVSQSVIN